MLHAVRDTFRLLLKFTQNRLHRSPAALALEEIDAPLVTAFLEELEASHGSGARTSVAHYAALGVRIERVLTVCVAVKTCVIQTRIIAPLDQCQITDGA